MAQKLDRGSRRASSANYAYDVWPGTVDDRPGEAVTISLLIGWRSTRSLQAGRHLIMLELIPVAAWVGSGTSWVWRAPSALSVLARSSG